MPANPLMTTYDPKLVIITYGGVPLGGFADGTFVDIAPSSEGFTRKVGADGEVTRSKSADNCHDVTVTLMQSSLNNEYLSTINQMDRATGAGLLPLTITDLNGGTLCFWPQAWVEVPSSWGYAKEDTERGWVFHTGQIATDNRGGNLH
jgi:hypothetical protein